MDKYTLLEDPKIWELMLLRFNLKVNKTETCWLWTGGQMSNYGNVYIPLNKGLAIYAHRVSYMIYNNIRRIPVEYIVCHKCDNKLCVNPSHLYLGTATDNARDRYK